MIRILVFAAILVTMLSPVSAQELAGPLSLNIGALTAGLQRPMDESCYIGNGSSPLAPPAATPGFAPAALVAGPELPRLTLPNASTNAYHYPRSLAWLPDSAPLFSNPESASGLAFEVPLLFPGLADHESRLTPAKDYNSPAALGAVAGNRPYAHLSGATGPDRFVIADNPASILPAGMHDAMAGLHRLWNCIGGDFLAAAAAGGGPAAVAGPALPASPHWELHDAANNLGGLGRIYRASYNNAPGLVVNRFVSSNKEETALRVSEAEATAAGVGCFKASSNGQVAAIKQANGNIVIAMGPDFENKTFYVIFNGGVKGQVGGTVTNNDGAPGANC